MADKTQENLQALINAANQKLQAQEKIAQKEDQIIANGGDIYAEMRNEMNESLSSPGNASISYQNAGPMPNVNIQHEPIPEQDIDIITENPVFDGGPGIAQIEIWKKQFSKEKVYHTQILNRDFIFRTLNRFEYKQIVALENIDALYREELICQTCVLWPIGYNFQQMAQEDSGYPSTLAQIIMENSGFTKEYGIEVL